MVLRGLAGVDGVGHVKVDHAVAFIIGAAVALVGPTSQQVALLRLRPIHWLAVPIGIVLLLLLLQSGSRTPSEFIYFQF